MISKARDIAAIVGASSLVYGVYTISAPAGFIAAGVLLLSWSVLSAWGSK